MKDKGLTEKKNDMITRAEEVLEQAKQENRELTEDEAAELAKIRDNVRKIVATLELNDDFDRMKEAPKAENAPEQKRCEDEEAAFADYIRGELNTRSATNLTPASNSGGKLIPTTIADRIIKKVYDICPILARSQKYNVKGKLEIPKYDTSTDTITVAYASEFTPLTSHSGKFTTVSLDGFLAGALCKISRSLINKVDFDIVGFVVDEMAYQIARFIEGELLHGTADYVEGLSGVTNTITAASSTVVTADEIVRLHDSVKDEFQGNGIWIMSPATRTAVRTLKANTGYYLLQDDISTPFGATILGKPVYVSDNMDDMAAGKTAIYYGDMTGLATKFSEEINIEVLREAFATEHAVAVVGWFEVDAKLQDTQKISALVMKS